MYENQCSIKMGKVHLTNSKASKYLYARIDSADQLEVLIPPDSHTDQQIFYFILLKKRIRLCGFHQTRLNGG